MHERDRAFRHLAWVDFVERLGGPRWVPFSLLFALLVLGVAATVRGLDRTQP